MAEPIPLSRRPGDIALVVFFSINALWRLFPIFVLYRMISRPHPFAAVTRVAAAASDETSP